MKNTIVALLSLSAAPLLLCGQESKFLHASNGVATIDHDPRVPAHRPSLGDGGAGAFSLFAIAVRLPRPVIHAFDLQNHDTPMVLTIPDAAKVVVTSAARGSDGATGISGNAYDAYGHRAAFVALLAPGQETKVIRMPGLFYADLIALPDDGSIWVKGWEPKEITGTYVDLSAPLVRKFDKNGNQLTGVLPMSSLFPTVARHRLTDPCGFLVATSSRVAWLKACSAGVPYFEFTGQTAASVKFLSPPVAPPPGGEYLTGFALTQSGDVFITKSTRKDGSRLYRLDRDAGAWVEVAFSPNLPGSRETSPW